MYCKNYIKNKKKTIILVRYHKIKKENKSRHNKKKKNITNIKKQNNVNQINKK